MAQDHHRHDDHDHDHAHDHDHDHGAHGHSHAHAHGPGGHSHAPKDFGRAFAIGVGLNFAFVLAEAAVGLWSGSLALLADAGHNLSDVLSLLLAWGATILAKSAPTSRRTYGLRKATILASLANAVLLLVAVGVIISEAIHRFSEPAPIATWPVMIVAAIGVVINTATALMFMKGHDDLNIRGAFLHMAADAGVSLAVVVGAGLIALTGMLWIDPALSVLIAVVIVIGTWALLRESVDLALDAAPRGLDVQAVRAWLLAQPGVTEVHDLHVWAMSTTETAMTAHVTRPDNADGDAFLHAACEGLASKFRIGHATLQVETGHSASCRLASVHAI
ncbi:cobalt transporter [Phenylobacterium sp. Root77]|uniref:cation diffusion facilitator family transporter n=1 Tax=unclassified Phenylobacterium TaxID=2640670 RepID=UPI0006FEF8CA|nr:MULTISPECIES: cation diffusion facilitator family transporter [unclassified Phenylobacterium]KQW73186.1 cobalt transporter [Phenylobacterium sp. Root1277]KQW92406.1 cobalt transporter [Phenylobacterium sp. Root1290]KRC40635.1 cobalt transporter [Phenylobacterium sp. Root77]